MEADDLQMVAGITLRYYDKAYAHGVSQRPPEKVFELAVKKDDPEDNARKILEMVKERIPELV